MNPLVMAALSRLQGRGGGPGPLAGPGGGFLAGGADQPLPPQLQAFLDSLEGGEGGAPSADLDLGPGGSPPMGMGGPGMMAMPGPGGPPGRPPLGPGGPPGGPLVAAAQRRAKFRRGGGRRPSAPGGPRGPMGMPKG